MATIEEQIGEQSSMSLPCWAHSFVLRRHPSVGPQIPLEMNIGKVHKQNHVIDITHKTKTNFWDFISLNFLHFWM